MQFCDELFQHDHAVAAPDHMGVKGIGQNPPIVVIAHIGEIRQPVLSDEPGVHEPWLNQVLGAHVFEDRKVVESPADGHLYNRRVRAVGQRLLQGDHIAVARLIGQIVVAHQAAVVDEIMLEKQGDGVRAEIPGRRAIAPRVAAGEFLDRLVAA